jgi:hypothetical protein
MARKPTKTRKHSKNQLLISILLSNESGIYIAQCLEWDIAAQGLSTTEALQNFEGVFWARALRDWKNDRPLFSDLDPAPDEFWQLFRTGFALRDAYPLKPPASVRITRAEAIEIRLAA